MATRTRKVLIGCGAGCLGLIVLSIGACVSLSIWVNQRGDLFEPTRLLGGDTAGYVELALREDDPGAQQFVRGMVEAFQRLQARSPNRGPAWLNTFARRGEVRNQDEAVRKMLPSVLAWRLTPGEQPQEDLHLFIASVASLENQGRLMDLMLRFMAGMRFSSRYGDERIYSTDEVGALFIRDGSFFVTNSVENARRAIDRLRSGDQALPAAPTALEGEFAALAREAALRGVVGNTRDELWRIWQILGGAGGGAEIPPSFQAIEGARITGGFVGDRGFEALIVLDGPDEAWATAAAVEWLTLLRETYDRGHLAAQFETLADGERVRLTVRVDDLLSFIEEL